VRTEHLAPTASIILLTRHGPERLRRCLDALARLPDAVPHETFVLLNGADADVRAVLQSRPVRVIESPVNLGFAAGCNHVAALTTGRYLVFLNDDTEAAPGWLSALVDVAEQQPRVGAVGSCVLFPDGTVQEAGAIVWRDGSAMSLGRGLRPNSPRVSFVRQVDYCSACSLLVPREAWRTAGGFCPDYFPAYYEDVDFCLTLRTLGYRVLYAPHSRVTHVGGSSTDPSFRSFLNEYHRRRLQQRWSAYLSELEPPDGESAAAVRRAVFRASGCCRRLLVIVDRLPSKARAASRRMWDAVVELSRGGYAICMWTPHPTNRDIHDLGLLGVEIVGEDLETHLRDAGVLYDTVLIVGPHNFDWHSTVVRRTQPHATVVYDAAAIYHRRLERPAASVRRPLASVLASQALALRAVETKLRARVDFVTCASPDERTFFHSIEGTAPITIVAPDRHGASTWTEALRVAQFRARSRGISQHDTRASQH
jgi:GT2 family glycosyltransferase